MNFKKRADKKAHNFCHKNEEKKIGKAIKTKIQERKQEKQLKFHAKNWIKKQKNGLVTKLQI